MENLIDVVLEGAMEAILDYMYSSHNNGAHWASGVFVISTPNDFGDRMVMAIPRDLKVGKAYSKVVAFNGEYYKELSYDEASDWIEDIKGYELEMLDLEYLEEVKKTC